MKKIVVLVFTLLTFVCTAFAADRQPEVKSYKIVEAENNLTYVLKDMNLRYYHTNQNNQHFYFLNDFVTKNDSALSNYLYNVAFIKECKQCGYYAYFEGTQDIQKNVWHPKVFRQYDFNSGKLIITSVKAEADKYKAQYEHFAGSTFKNATKFSKFVLDQINKK